MHISGLTFYHPGHTFIPRQGTWCAGKGWRLAENQLTSVKCISKKTSDAASDLKQACEYKGVTHAIGYILQSGHLPETTESSVKIQSDNLR